MYVLELLGLDVNYILIKNEYFLNFRKGIKIFIVQLEIEKVWLKILNDMIFYDKFEKLSF